MNIRECIARINAAVNPCAAIPREYLAIDRDTPLKDRELLSTEREAIEREIAEKAKG